LGFQKALDNLDAVIQLIRAAANPREAREGLIARFEFTEKQAQAIIELQLQRLTGMEQQKIIDELAEIQVRIAGYLEILGSEKVLKDLMVKELKEVQKDYGDERILNWITKTGTVALISDNRAVEASPSRPCTEDHCASLPLHAHCLFKLGVYLGEIWLLSDLADWLRANGRSRFLLTAPPLRLPGAVGSPANAVATV